LATVFFAPRSNVTDLHYLLDLILGTLKALGVWAKTEDLLYLHIFTSIVVKSLVQHTGNYMQSDRYIYKCSKLGRMTSLEKSSCSI